MKGHSQLLRARRLFPHAFRHGLFRSQQQARLAGLSSSVSDVIPATPVSKDTPSLLPISTEEECTMSAKMTVHNSRIAATCSTAIHVDPVRSTADFVSTTIDDSRNEGVSGNFEICSQPHCERETINKTGISKENEHLTSEFSLPSEVFSSEVIKDEKEIGKQMKDHPMLVELTDKLAERARMIRDGVDQSNLPPRVSESEMIEVLDTMLPIRNKHWRVCQGMVDRVWGAHHLFVSELIEQRKKLVLSKRSLSHSVESTLISTEYICSLLRLIANSSQNQNRVNSVIDLILEQDQHMHYECNRLLKQMVLSCYNENTECVMKFKFRLTGDSNAARLLFDRFCSSFGVFGGKRAANQVNAGRLDLTDESLLREILACFVARGNVTRAMEFVLEMHRQHSLEITPSLTWLVWDLLKKKVDLGNADFFARFLLENHYDEIFDRMERLDPETPNRVHYILNPYLRVCLDAGDWQRCLKFIERIDAINLESLKLLINVFESNGEIHNYLDSMRKKHGISKRTLSSSVKNNAKSLNHDANDDDHPRDRVKDWNVFAENIPIWNQDLLDPFILKQLNRQIFKEKRTMIENRRNNMNYEEDENSSTDNNPMIQRQLRITPKAKPNQVWKLILSLRQKYQIDLRLFPHSLQDLRKKNSVDQKAHLFEMLGDLDKRQLQILKIFRKLSFIAFRHSSNEELFNLFRFTSVTCIHALLDDTITVNYLRGFSGRRSKYGFGIGMSSVRFGSKNEYSGVQMCLHVLNAHGLSYFELLRDPRYIEQFRLTVAQVLRFCDEEFSSMERCRSLTGKSTVKNSRMKSVENDGKYASMDDGNVMDDTAESLHNAARLLHIGIQTVDNIMGHFQYSWHRIHQFDPRVYSALYRFCGTMQMNLRFVQSLLLRQNESFAIEYGSKCWSILRRNILPNYQSWPANPDASVSHSQKSKSSQKNQNSDDDGQKESSIQMRIRQDLSGFQQSFIKNDRSYAYNLVRKGIDECCVPLKWDPASIPSLYFRNLLHLSSHFGFNDEIKSVINGLASRRSIPEEDSLDESNNSGITGVNLSLMNTAIQHYLDSHICRRKDLIGTPMEMQYIHDPHLIDSLLTDCIGTSCVSRSWLFDDLHELSPLNMACLMYLCLLSCFEVDSLSDSTSFANESYASRDRCERALEFAITLVQRILLSADYSRWYRMRKLHPSFFNHFLSLLELRARLDQVSSSSPDPSELTESRQRCLDFTRRFLLDRVWPGIHETGKNGGVPKLDLTYVSPYILDSVCTVFFQEFMQNQRMSAVSVRCDALSELSVADWEYDCPLPFFDSMAEPGRITQYKLEFAEYFFMTRFDPAFQPDKQSDSSVVFYLCDANETTFFTDDYPESINKSKP